MALVKVGSIAQFAPDSVREASVGEQRYAICNTGGNFYALSGTCPHRGGPLGQGAVEDGRITCPWHAWQFDCRTGENDYNPGIQVPTFPVQIAGDDILIDIP